MIDDDGVRSLILSTRLLGTKEIMMINHTDCGMLRFTDNDMVDRLRKLTGRRRLHRPSSMASGMRVLFPEYRLAPEHPFPAAIDHVLATNRQM